MGEITVEGLGVIEIEGDEPNEQEQKAILEAIGDPEAEEDDLTTILPTGQQPQPPQEAPQGPETGLFGQETDPGQGPLGIVSGGTRQAVRGAVEGQPGLLQLATEITPSIGGALAGAGAGGLVAGPPGAFVGGIAGGFLGELGAQETGVAPESNLNLGLAAAGPVIGKGVGQAFRLTRRGAGALITKAPFAKSARAKNVTASAVEEFESIGTKILGKQTGLRARPAGDLYAAVNRAGVTVPGRDLNSTRRAVSELITELKPISAFPEARQAMAVLRQVEKSLAGVNTMEAFVRTRSLVGAAIKRAQSAGGIKLGGAKKVFAALSDDLDRFAAQPNLTGRAARLAKEATARAKLEFAVKDLEQGVARFITDAPNSAGASINIPGLQKWLRGVTNPKSRQFNKNFAAALKDELPAINSRLDELAKIVSAGGPGGPGSLVIRGQFARLGRGAVGAVLGSTMGPIGAGAGAVAGANLPEMLVGLLTTKSGAAFLEGAARMGKGQISQRAWITLGQIVTRSAGEKSEPPADTNRPGRTQDDAGPVIGPTAP